jgi:hypothetical protein
VIVITTIRGTVIVVMIAVMATIVAAATTIRDNREFGAASAIHPHLAALHSKSASLDAGSVTVLVRNAYAIVGADFAVVAVHIIGIAGNDPLSHRRQAGSGNCNKQE